MRVNLDNISLVLHKPRYPENIGASARAACNMGITRLVVVDPEDCDLSRVLKMATHVAAPVVEAMDVVEDLRTALEPFQYVVGTTARIGSRRLTCGEPGKIMGELVPVSQENRIAFLFGPENKGLTNAELGFCHAIVTIPTADFASLNLAQAVMVLCYEAYLASVEAPSRFTPRLATRRELEDMYDQLKETLVHIHFINPENPDYWMQQVRRFFSRVDMRSRDVRMIRGVCRQIEWYGSRFSKKD